ncbi:hypothetical protein KGR20_23035 [Cytobacillus oceanisediminis]|uniref:hypothetical protein n=1 Tax=Cytobacillus oceanisediminis TaxID=665099 RepID=UPI001CCAE4BE|nr:hypothetical protein [Cytobacillus oceanisediminis]MBZ9537037.1 hypothetical protein [Cytobacillus oceanisediminis]
MNIPFENRPTCSCEAKMKLIGYKGYYEEFRYWECNNCGLFENMQDSKIKADKEWKGSYR